MKPTTNPRRPVKSKLLVCCAAALTLATPLFAQTSITESGRGGRLRLDGGSSSTAGTNPLFDDRPLGDLPVEKVQKPSKKSKGPTEIVALGATFDQKAHQAVFIGQVVVTDPEFNVQCDKLTAFLAHNDNQPAEDNSGRLSVNPDAEPKAEKKRKGGGLEKAIAEAELGNVVTIRQEKLEADGSTSNSVGRGRKAVYDAVTGDITLTGRPEVQQGMNNCVATDDATVMVLNRDGRMRVDGPHRTTIKDQGDTKK